MTVTVSLRNGPAAGIYETEFPEPPETLQAVSSIDGAAAVLDLPEDLPLLGERLHTYHRLGRGFMCQRSGPGRGCHQSWVYELLPPELELVPDPDPEED